MKWQLPAFIDRHVLVDENEGREILLLYYIVLHMHGMSVMLVNSDWDSGRQKSPPPPLPLIL